MSRPRNIHGRLAALEAIEEEVARRVERQVKAELHLMFAALDGALPDEQFRKVCRILIEADEKADRRKA